MILLRRMQIPVTIAARFLLDMLLAGTGRFIAKPPKPKTDKDLEESIQ